jgi:hypothetical protein
MERVSTVHKWVDKFHMQSTISVVLCKFKSAVAGVAGFWSLGIPLIVLFVISRFWILNFNSENREDNCMNKKHIVAKVIACSLTVVGDIGVNVFASCLLT